MMSRIRLRGEEIRKFILQNVDGHPTDICRMAAEHFGITRQAINVQLQKLTHEGSLKVRGKTNNKSYKLAPIVRWSRMYEITESLEEHVVWREDIQPALGELPDNVRNIWQYGFTEMFNNVRDHSDGSLVTVRIEKTAVYTEMGIFDNGVGIFRKIQTALKLSDERHAVFELAKGKLTTDPNNHSGEGIFFTSRMFDQFNILSAGVYFSHDFGEVEDWIMERENPEQARTSVWMKLNNHTARTQRKIFDMYTSPDTYGFTKTVVPVKMAQYGDEQLVSRSQAKRVLARVDRFKVVVLNFEGVTTIGQGFADEIFRVFKRQHPETEINYVRANSEVKRMIMRVESDGTAPTRLSDLASLLELSEQQPD